MKKLILISLLVALLILTVGYYYFYILNPVEEQAKAPSKIRIAIQKPVTSIKVTTTAKSEQKKEQITKEQPKKAIEKKESEKKPIQEQKAESQIAKKEKEVAKLDETKEKSLPPKSLSTKSVRKPKGYSIIYIASNEDEALKIKDDVISKGYHTAKVGKYKDKNAVIISPFTDKWEAEYVLKNIEKDTNIKNFRVITK